MSSGVASLKECPLAVKTRSRSSGWSCRSSSESPCAIVARVSEHLLHLCVHDQLGTALLQIDHVDHGVPLLAKHGSALRCGADVGRRPHDNEHNRFKERASGASSVRRLQDRATR